MVPPAYPYMGPYYINMFAPYNAQAYPPQPRGRRLMENL